MTETLSFGALGKAAKDLLSGGFQLNQKVTATTKTDTGVDFTVSGVKKDDKLDGDIKAAYKASCGYSADIKVSADSKVTSTIAYSKLFPGLKVSLNGSIPDKASGKVRDRRRPETACAPDMFAGVFVRSIRHQNRIVVAVFNPSVLRRDLRRFSGPRGHRTEH